MRAAKLRSAAAAIVRQFDIVAFEPQDDREALGGIAIVVGEQDALVRRATAVDALHRLPADSAWQPPRSADAR